MSCPVFVILLISPNYVGLVISPYSLLHEKTESLTANHPIRLRQPYFYLTIREIGAMFFL